ncbi:MAG: hypothetical protein OXI57_10195 [Rhodospirillales bacterium]|nr:hypothetical protein [Rhodospirillales bacterium]
MALQGTLDGLCGPYAIVNAYHLCDLDEDWLGQDILEISCSELQGWPEALWSGTSFEQMRQMLDACQQRLKSAYEEANVDYPITVDYPFEKQVPATSKRYWKEFDNKFKNNHVVCGIAGMEHPDKHWFAFINWRDSLLAFDSFTAPWSGFHRMPRSRIHAGSRNISDYILNREELIVFNQA